MGFTGPIGAVVVAVTAGPGGVGAAVVGGCYNENRLL